MVTVVFTLAKLDNNNTIIKIVFNVYQGKQNQTNTITSVGTEKLTSVQIGTLS